MEPKLKDYRAPKLKEAWDYPDSYSMSITKTEAEAVFTSIVSELGVDRVSRAVMACGVLPEGDCRRIVHEIKKFCAGGRP